jgi:hypothetical protein
MKKWKGKGLLPISDCCGVREVCNVDMYILHRTASYIGSSWLPLLKYKNGPTRPGRIGCPLSPPCPYHPHACSTHARSLLPPSTSAAAVRHRHWRFEAASSLGRPKQPAPAQEPSHEGPCTVLYPSHGLQHMCAPREMGGFFVTRVIEPYPAPGPPQVTSLHKLESCVTIF